MIDRRLRALVQKDEPPLESLVAVDLAKAVRHERRARFERQGAHVLDGARARRLGQRRDRAALHLRERKRLEVDTSQRRERAERSDVQFAHIVARHVLDDHAAGFRDRSVGQDDGRADDEIARSPVRAAARSRPAGGKRPADGAGRGPRRVDRQKLTLRVQRARQLCQRRSGEDPRREIARFVVDDAAQSLQAHGDVVARRRCGHRLQRVTAEQDEGFAAFVAACQQPGERFDVLRAPSALRRGAPERELRDRERARLARPGRGHTHASSVAPVACAPRAARTSPQTAPLGKILSGLNRSCGSNEPRTRPIVARSSVLNTRPSVARFS